MNHWKLTCLQGSVDSLCILAPLVRAILTWMGAQSWIFYLGKLDRMTASTLCPPRTLTTSAVALYRPVRNAQQHFPRLVSLQSEARAPWRIADNVTAKWVCVGSPKHGPTAYNYSHENSRSQVSESGVGSM